MVAITETFIELFKRQPNEADKIRLMSVQKALRLPDDDPLWTILVALDYYQKLYEEAPARILEATQTAAHSTITAAESTTTEKLVNGALAIAHERMEQNRVFQWPLVIVCVILSIALVALGVSFWLATKQFQVQEAEIVANHKIELAAVQEQFDHALATKISEVESSAASQLATDRALLEWIKQYSDLYENKDFHERIDFVAHNQVFVDAIRALNVTQQDNLIRIISKADHWREIRTSAKLPWPCFSVTRTTKNAIICQVGLEGEISPARPKPSSP